MGLLRGCMDSKVYFAQCNFGGPIKVGTSGNIDNRISVQAAGLPFDLVLIGSVPGGLFREAFVHCWFRDYAVRTEWFAPVPELMSWAIQARATGQIFGLPDEPSRMYRAQTSELVRITEYRRIKLSDVARYADYRDGTLELKLKAEHQSSTRLLAAFAVAHAKAGHYLNLDSVGVPGRHLDGLLAASALEAPNPRERASSPDIPRPAAAEKAEIGA